MSQAMQECYVKQMPDQPYFAHIVLRTANCTIATRMGNLLCGRKRHLIAHSCSYVSWCPRSLLLNKICCIITQFAPCYAIFSRPRIASCKNKIKVSLQQIQFSKSLLHRSLLTCFLFSIQTAFNLPPPQTKNVQMFTSFAMMNFWVWEQLLK